MPLNGKRMVVNVSSTDSFTLQWMMPTVIHGFALFDVTVPPSFDWNHFVVMIWYDITCQWIRIKIKKANNHIGCCCILSNDNLRMYIQMNSFCLKMVLKNVIVVVYIQLVGYSRLGYHFRNRVYWIQDFIKSRWPKTLPLSEENLLIMWGN